MHELQEQLLMEYKTKFEKLHVIAEELYKLHYDDLYRLVIAKMSGLKMMIDHLEEGAI